MPSTPSPIPAQIVIAIDPHKASRTAVAVDNRLQPLDVLRVEVNRDGHRQLRRFARRWPAAVWAIEGATVLGATLTARLTTDHIDVLDVTAKLARRVRMLSTGYGRKSDPADALSVGIAAHTATPPQHRRRRRGHRRLTRPDRAPRRPGPHPHPDRQPATCTTRPAHSRGPAPRTDR